MGWHLNACPKKKGQESGDQRCCGGWLARPLASSTRVTCIPLQFLQGCDPELCIRWQVLDKRIPLHANHKELLHKVSTLLGAYY